MECASLALQDYARMTENYVNTDETGCQSQATMLPILVCTHNHAYPPRANPLQGRCPGMLFLYPPFLAKELGKP